MPSLSVSLTDYKGIYLMNIKQIMQEAGIVGAGGAGFPSYAKFADGVDILLINAAECEPLLYTDYVILTREMSTVLDGARLVADALGAKEIYLGIKSHNAQKLGIQNGDILPCDVVACVLPDVYPMGDEISLIYESTGRLVQPGNLPISQGVVVYNVETLYNVSRAVRFGINLTKKWLTVGGDIETPSVLCVPIGTPFSTLFEKLGITVPETHICMDGGPSMGRIVNPLQATVTKTTKGILILPREIPAVSMKLREYNRHVTVANSVCCQCTNCTEMCPRALLGYPLEPHRLVRASREIARTMPEQFVSALLCCGCGICEIAACCQFISPKAVIAGQKSILAQEKIRYPQNLPKVEPSEARSSRMVPSSRWRALLGVSHFHREATYGGKIEADEVSVLTKQHIGAPSLPTVKVGDAVKAGQVIAAAGNGLSIPQHASIDGQVTFCDENYIRIQKQV